MASLSELALTVEPVTPEQEDKPSRAGLRTGDEVFLSGGPYRGTPGVFLRLRADANWADIAELNGNVRSHPVEWLSRREC